MLAGFVYAIIDPPALPSAPWTGDTTQRPGVAAGPGAPSLMPKNIPSPGTSGPTAAPRPTTTTSATPTAVPTTAVPTATATKTRRGNPTHIPPGLAKKTKTP